MARLAALDGLRGIAIALVLVCHGWHWNGGGEGVDLFFVLSGYLITRLLIAEWSRSGTLSLRRFYGRRIVRLYPALLAMLAAYLFTDALLTPRGTAGHAAAAAALGASYLTNLLLVVDPGVIARRLWHLWSLAEEEQFYLLWPPILLLLLRRGVRLGRLVVLLAAAAAASTLVGFVLVAHGAGGYRVWYGPDTHAAPIIIGCLIALLPVAASRKLNAAATVAAIVAAFCLSFDTTSLWWVPSRMLAFSVSAGVVLLWATVAGGPVAALLACKPLAFLGRVSYGVYLWHFPLLQIGHPYLVLPLSVLLGWQSWRLIEAPLLRRYRSAREPRAAAALTPQTSTG